jgi:uncharacterized protein (TIRG00374 family)
MAEYSRWLPTQDSATKIVRWGVSLTLLGVLAFFVNLQEVYRILQSADLLLLGGALGVSLVDRLLMAGKWFPLLRVQLPDVEVGRAVRAYFAAGVAEFFLPSHSGDVLRSLGLGRDDGSIVEVGASIVVERLLGLVATGIVVLLVLWVALSTSIPMGVLLPWALACVGASVLVTVLPFSSYVRRQFKKVLNRFGEGRCTRLIERFGKAYQMYRGHSWTLFVVGFLSLVQQFAPVLMFWVGARALHLNLSLVSIFVAVPLTFFVARLPISVAGLGIVEGGLTYLLGLFGADVSQAVSLALAGRVIRLFTLLPGLFWWEELIGKESWVQWRENTFVDK